MHITLSPQRRDDTLKIVKAKEVLTINGKKYDFSVVPEGALLPKEAVDCPWIAADVERIEGILHLTLILPISADASEAARFPAHIIDPADGPLEFPK